MMSHARGPSLHLKAKKRAYFIDRYVTEWTSTLLNDFSSAFKYKSLTLSLLLIRISNAINARVALIWPGAISWLIYSKIFLAFCTYDYCSSKRACCSIKVTKSANFEVLALNTALFYSNFALASAASFNSL